MLVGQESWSTITPRGERWIWRPVSQSPLLVSWPPPIRDCHHQPPPTAPGLVFWPGVSPPQAHAEQRRTLQAAEPPGRVAVAEAEAEAWRALEAAEGPARQKAQGAAGEAFLTEERGPGPQARYKGKGGCKGTPSKPMPGGLDLPPPSSWRT